MHIQVAMKVFPSRFKRVVLPQGLLDENPPRESAQADPSLRVLGLLLPLYAGRERTYIVTELLKGITNVAGSKLWNISKLHVHHLFVYIFFYQVIL